MGTGLKGEKEPYEINSAVLGRVLMLRLLLKYPSPQKLISLEPLEQIELTRCWVWGTSGSAGQVES